MRISTACGTAAPFAPRGMEKGQHHGHWALNGLSWAVLAASVVASFGISTVLAGTIYAYAKK